MDPIFKDFYFQKQLLWLNGSLPLVLLFTDILTNKLGANPAEAFIRTTGVIGLIFLILSLLVTPLSKIFTWTWLIRHRRWLGLWAFYYALVHLIAYSAFDKGLIFTDIIADIYKRPFILLGFLCFCILLPLAITSSDQMIKKMGGKNWRKLHTLTYVAIILACAHYWLIVKSDLKYPLFFAIATAGLLIFRLYKKFI